MTGWKTALSILAVLLAGALSAAADENIPEEVEHHPREVRDEVLRNVRGRAQDPFALQVPATQGIILWDEARVNSDGWIRNGKTQCSSINHMKGR